MKLSRFLISTKQYKLNDFQSTPNKYEIINCIGKSFEEKIKKKNNYRKNAIATALIEREELVTTGVGYGVAFPNASVKGIDEIAIQLYGLPGFEWQAMDKKPVYLAISCIAPKKMIGTHLNVMAKLTYVMKLKKNRKNLIKAVKEENTKTIYSILDSVE
ncbi:MAG: PTS sugar transporter subunit IIA [Nanoarchaeota archaeon]|nr:PTS sugar transporter subunit IIA [Nanoarchaeota archaeon]MBU1028447.1 PTS sugar transporter subunit IIA [Nanoarchaeota archaeon]